MCSVAAGPATLGTMRGVSDPSEERAQRADETAAGPGVGDPERASVRDRFGAFYAFYLGLFALLFAYLISVALLEAGLQAAFQVQVENAIAERLLVRTDAPQVERAIAAAVHESRWVRWGGLEVSTLVLAKDGETALFVDGFGVEGFAPAVATPDPAEPWTRWLPVQARVNVRLPHNALAANLLLILYSTLLIGVVYVANRRLVESETQRLASIRADRNAAADRAGEIQSELESTRSRLADLEPVGEARSEEIRALEAERSGLRRRLAELADQEEALRTNADQAMGLAQEVRALEDLLEEASGDLETKDAEIARLEENLASANRGSGRRTRTRSRESERLARRFRTLYKTIEIDDRAYDDLAALGDESLRLKAEEAIKRLAEEAENVAVRRKVGGLPERLSIFELGFAGKGRIYYARGRSHRFRILLVGAKNSQSADLDFLRRHTPDD